MSKEQDFTLYARTVVRHLKENPDKFPQTHKLLSRMASAEVIDLITVGIGSVCAWHFNRNHPTAVAAKDIESCVTEGFMNAELITMMDDGKVH